MKKKIILKSSILAVAAGLSVFAINSVFVRRIARAVHGRQ